MKHNILQIQNVTGIALLIGIAACAISAVRQAAGQDPSESPQGKTAEELPRVVVDTHELMSLFNKPLYKLLKEQMQTEPTSEEAWRSIAERGLQAAEVANLVAMRKETEKWQELASGLQEAGIHLNEVAKTKDFAETAKAYRTLLQRCNTCHQTMSPDHAPKLEP